MYENMPSLNFSMNKICDCNIMIIFLDVIAFLLFIFFIDILECSICPSNEDMSPCECLFLFGANQISCKNILSPEELIPPMRAIAMKKTKVLALTIDKSSLLYLPDNLFKNTHIEKVSYFLIYSIKNNNQQI